MQIRTLQIKDVSAYRDFRLRALREHPEAFAASYEEEQHRPREEIALGLVPGSEHVTLGAFHEGELAGIATIVRSARSKLRHKATITSMYVAPQARGLGIGRVLLQEVTEIARGWEGATEVSLAVTVGNEAARALYARHGFMSWGIEPRCLCVGGRYFDVEWMVLHLERATK